jgi:hypothetical protein
VHGLIVALLPAMLPSGVIATVFASRGGQSSGGRLKINVTRFSL